MDDWLDCWSDDAVIDGIGQCLVGKAQAKDPQMAFSDVYEDVLVKQDGRWRFKGVKMTQDKLPTV